MFPKDSLLLSTAPAIDPADPAQTHLSFPGTDARDLTPPLFRRQVQVLERQVTLLADNQHNEDDRYTRSKQDNATLQARLIMMEEQVSWGRRRVGEKSRGFDDGGTGAVVGVEGG